MISEVPERFDEDVWEAWADTLADEGVVVLDRFLPEEILGKMQNLLFAKLEEEDFKKAGIGALGDFRLERSIRGDYVYWLDPIKDKDTEAFFDFVEDVMKRFNRLCFLGASASEFHLAHYPAGTHYARHLDQFKERSNRLISMVFYLNTTWQPHHGGELRIYDEQGGHRDIPPIPGRAVIFRSDKIEHEVRHTTVSRYSLTGWLLRHPVGVGYIG